MNGNIADDSPAYTNDIAKIMDKHHKARFYHQQADTDSRIKKMLATRNKEYNEYQYEDGEDIFVKDKNKELWEGPVKVQHQEGNNHQRRKSDISSNSKDPTGEKEENTGKHHRRGKRS